MNIKTLLLALGLSVMMLNFKCSKEEIKVAFDMQAKDVTFVVKASPAAGQLNIDAQNITYNLDSLCTVNSINKDQITSVKIKEVYLDILDPISQTFDIVDFAKAEISSPGKPQVMLAEKNPVPKGGLKTVQLDIKDVELVDYIKSNNMSFFTSGQSNAPLTNDVTMKARVKFTITGQVFK